MAQSTLVNDEVNAAVQFLEEFSKHTKVTVAVLLRSAVWDGWRLYLGVDLADPALIDALREARRVDRETRGLFNFPLSIKFMGPTHGVSVAALDALKTQMSRRLGARTFGGMEIDEALLLKGPNDP